MEKQKSNDMFLRPIPGDIKRNKQSFLLVKPLSSRITDRQRPVFGSGKGLFIMSDDFDEPLEDFKEYR